MQRPDPTPPALVWQDGWHRDARRMPSPNQGSRPEGAVVDLVVVHSISLPPGHFGTGQVQRLFTNQLDWQAHPYFAHIRGLEVSSHFFIERSGALWQFVDARQRAWHAGRSRYRGRNDCNDDSVGVELEGLEGGSFEPDQYAALEQLCRDLLVLHPIRYIAGHEHIAPVRKQDPGAGFDWRRLSQPLAGSGILFAPGCTSI